MHPICDTQRLILLEVHFWLNCPEADGKEKGLWTRKWNIEKENQTLLQLFGCLRKQDEKLRKNNFFCIWLSGNGGYSFILIIIRCKSTEADLMTGIQVEH
ncbi:hypothetical protein NE237_017191 [Protea cynaroides]|uniref:Uncharacterized protein n=1 Tax=Protea cynaroides TaxID=273540 RepID=A0A9Q0K7K2_9MAGN|nr:hypothetical protein NE237_017191 [Protea cynaroides]